jgi:hypothetical protein
MTKMKHDLVYKTAPRYAEYKRRHESHFSAVMISEADFKTISNSECYYCGQPGPNGIDRKDNGIGYVSSNCVPCCKHCNYVKGNLSVSDYETWKNRFVRKQMQQISKTSNLDELTFWR